MSSFSQKSTVLISRSWMINLGTDAGSKAYRLYDLVVKKVVVSRRKVGIVGTEIRTVDFRLNWETRKTLISQRSRISARANDK